MTKLRIMSDLHLEFGSLDLEPIGEDVLVLGGDIGLRTDGAKWAIDYSRRTGIPTVMIAGNHEFYNIGVVRYSLEEVMDELSELSANEPLFTFLNDDVRVVAGCTFVGSTLWTDYAIDGDPTITKLIAYHAMNDHRTIKVGRDRRPFTPDHAESLHRISIGILRESLPRRYRDGSVVVMTHHLPSPRSIDPRFFGSRLNAAYASQLDDLVIASEADLWVHGHTHSSADYVMGRTRVICNPRGYVGHELNPNFNVDLMVEL